MENNFKDILPNGLESYDNLEDKINEDGSFQLKVNSFTKQRYYSVVEVSLKPFE